MNGTQFVITKDGDRQRNGKSYV